MNKRRFQNICLIQFGIFLLCIFISSRQEMNFFMGTPINIGIESLMWVLIIAFYKYWFISIPSTLLGIVGIIMVIIDKFKNKED